MINLYNNELNIIDNVNAAILYCKNDEFSTILYANQYFYDLIGYTKEEMENLFNNRFSYLVIDNIPEILVHVYEVISRGDNLDYEFRMRKKDGSIIWVHDTAVYNKKENTFYVTLMDITYMKNVEYQKERFNNYLNNIPSKIVISNIDGIIEYKNNKAKNCETYPDIGENIKSYIFENIIGYHNNDLWDIVKNGILVEYETRIKSHGRFISHDINQLIPLKDEAGEIFNIMQVSENVTKNSDLLTHFPTRSMFENYYEKIKPLLKDNLNLYIVILDIDNFKKLNDIYGHIIGDDIILETANKLSSIINKKDYICRYGGDEFLLLLIDENDENITNRLIEISKAPLTNEKLKEFNVTYSIGVAKLENVTLSYSHLLNLADKALYNVKRNGRNNICFANDLDN